MVYENHRKFHKEMYDPNGCEIQGRNSFIRE